MLVKRIFFLLIVVTTVSGALFPVIVLAAEPEPVGKAALLMDADNGQVLYGKNQDDIMYPASTTKIMTALLALERSSSDDMVDISRRAAEIGGSRVGLQPGEKVKMGDLLYILMLSSANDAAVAVAEHIGGSVEEFAELMNRQAKKIGATNTNFVNPHGMPDPNHHSTARDMALIGREAMKNNEFRQIVKTINYKVDRKGGMSSEVLQQVENLEKIYGPVQEDFYNHNRLVGGGYYGFKGANGIKTGYTNDAGQCIVASAERDGRELIAVVLNSQGANLWTDAAMLLSRGFEDFIPVKLVQPGEIITDTGVKNGSENAILETADSLYYNFPVDETPQIEHKVELQDNIVAPLAVEQILGKLVLQADNQVLGSVDLVNINPVNRKLTSYWWTWGGAVLVLLVLFGIAARWMRRRSTHSNVVYLKKGNRR